MDGKYTGRRYVHSLGEVKAIIKYENTCTIKFNEEGYSIEDAKKIGIERASIEIEKDIDTQNIKNKFIEDEETDEEIKVKVIYEVEENIGIYQKIE